jgi:hypothetical protein
VATTANTWGDGEGTGLGAGGGGGGALTSALASAWTSALALVKVMTGTTMSLPLFSSRRGAASPANKCVQGVRASPDCSWCMLMCPCVQIRLGARHSGMHAAAEQSGYGRMVLIWHC